MNITLHKSDTRGFADHGWLKSYHTFSFAGYYNPERIHFGTLRVLNDDLVAPGMGFGTHPHENMEIVTIPLSGMVAHKDSLGNEGIIHEGEIQVMSAGTGIYHSEYNGSKEEETSFLQIWILPREKGLQPRYGQKSLSEKMQKDKLNELISPSKEGEGLWLNSESWFYMGEFEKEKRITYRVNRTGNGIYIFMIKGQANIEGNHLDERDGAGVSGTGQFDLVVGENTRILLMEIPMTI